MLCVEAVADVVAVVGVFVDSVDFFLCIRKCISLPPGKRSDYQLERTGDQWREECDESPAATFRQTTLVDAEGRLSISHLSHPYSHPAFALPRASAGDSRATRAESGISEMRGVTTSPMVDSFCSPPPEFNHGQKRISATGPIKRSLSCVGVLGRWVWQLDQPWRRSVRR